MTNAQSKMTLIYIGDPMCSWCYGFSPEFSKVVKNLGEGTDLKIVMGGLRPYNTETMQDLSDFLKGHWEHVNEASNQPFNYGILDKDWVYDTEPASRAVLVIRRLAPEKEMAFFKAIQTAFYKENENPNWVETYLELAKEFDLNTDKFKELFLSEEMKNAVRKDFEFAGELGIRGFPSVVLKKGDKYHLVASGYTTSEKILKRIKNLERGY